MLARNLSPCQAPHSAMQDLSHSELLGLGQTWQLQVVMMMR